MMIPPFHLLTQAQTEQFLKEYVLAWVENLSREDFMPNNYSTVKPEALARLREPFAKEAQAVRDELESQIRAAGTPIVMKGITF